MADPVLCCGTCRTPLAITRDAIGRPRYRCPDCQGLAPVAAHVDETGRHQSATGAGSSEWPSPEPPEGAVWLRDDGSARAVRRCVVCHVPLPVAVLGRPRRTCANRQECAARALRLVDSGAPTKERIACEA